MWPQSLHVYFRRQNTSYLTETKEFLVRTCLFKIFMNKMMLLHIRCCTHCMTHACANPYFLTNLLWPVKGFGQ